ncbi:Fur family transcriptional regulator [Geminicoccus roseus]|uniref:Fur family transcriptional regulator n=1 Tax=Geminicoccus roseus TaxID=404900 RepID=UPI00040F1F43|nr:hypothetical protein [Geminicoccus roseus]
MTLRSATRDRRRLPAAALPATLLELLRQAGRPVGAYALLQMLSAKLERRISPHSLYRALGRLTGQGLVVRVERRDCYLATRHPGIAGARLFLICGICDAVEEKLSPRLDAQLAGEARASGFQVQSSVVEVEGACRSCADHGQLATTRPPTQADPPPRPRRLVCS